MIGSSNVASSARSCSQVRLIKRLLSIAVIFVFEIGCWFLRFRFVLFFCIELEKKLVSAHFICISYALVFVVVIWEILS